jgi:hypothetical protein
MFTKRQQENEKPVIVQQEQMKNDAKKFIEYANVSETQRLIMEELAKKKRNRIIKEEKRKIKNFYYVGQNMFVINDENNKQEFNKRNTLKKDTSEYVRNKSIESRPRWKDVEIPEDNIYKILSKYRSKS